MDYYESDFERRKMEPMYWFNKSMDMRNSAGAMWYAISNSTKVSQWLKSNCNISSGADHSVFDMLCGLSLELIYKAVIVSQKQPPKNIHRLNDLRVQAGIDATKEESAILDIYSHIIYWQAKYPAAIKSDHHRDYVKLVYDNLYDPVPGMSIKIIQPNHKMGWDLFISLWNEGAESFANHNPQLFG